MNMRSTTARRARCGAASPRGRRGRRLRRLVGRTEDSATPPAQTTATSGSTAAQIRERGSGGVKDYLLEHTSAAHRLHGGLPGRRGRLLRPRRSGRVRLRDAVGQNGDQVGPLVQQMKDGWIEGNPYYERVEGIVAGTPSLSEYDVILDAGSSAAEDPESAVPFDLTLADGTVLKQPGNLFNLTEGALWGTLPEELGHPSTPVDLDGDGQESFGEVLPDAGLLLAAAEAFDANATDLAADAEAWQPADSDAFTALVVMVPTMSEYFGQWKESRFVQGDSATAQSFNVVSRLSDIKDILGGLDVIYAGVEPLVATADTAQSQQTDQELDELIAFIGDLYAQEQAGNSFTAEEADTLGNEAQERATAIAGQVSQAAAQLGITIEQ